MRHKLLPALALLIALAAGRSPAIAAQPAAAKPLRPGVVLTFDDTFVAQWLAAQPIFAKHHARATFFVSQFDRFNAKQLAGLRELKAAGHVIGCHGLRHRKAVDTVQQSSVEEYLRIEIEPAVKLMQEAGLPPTCFAYPCSQRSDETDAALSHSFRHVRTGVGIEPNRTIAQTETIFTPVDAISSRFCLAGTGLDSIGSSTTPGRTLNDVFAALDRAAHRNEIVVLYAHNISDKGPSHHLSPAILDKILSHAATARLAFYTFDDL